MFIYLDPNAMFPGSGCIDFTREAIAIIMQGQAYIGTREST